MGSDYKEDDKLELGLENHFDERNAVLGDELHIIPIVRCQSSTRDVTGGIFFKKISKILLSIGELGLSAHFTLGLSTRMLLSPIS